MTREEDLERLERERWPMHHHDLLPGQKVKWFEQLWSDVVALQKRYHLPVRTDWWEHELQVETLAALAAWVQRYDSGEWDDPPGKLSLLFEIERIGVLLRDGPDPAASVRPTGSSNDPAWASSARSVL